jgi:PhzF family phenazine biosynthesis protein
MISEYCRHRELSFPQPGKVSLSHAVEQSAFPRGHGNGCVFGDIFALNSKSPGLELGFTSSVEGAFVKIKLYQIDAFTDKVFGGNPAAVCPLDHWLPEPLMQQIAAENNLAETAFFVRNGGRFEIRWFTPEVEVDLCGHGTLATGFVIFNMENFSGQVIELNSRSGLLRVSKNGDLLTLDFPSDKPKKSEAPEGLAEGLGLSPLEVYKGKTDYMLVYSKAEQIENMKPNMLRISEVAARGIIVTAPGNDVDFVSRFFAPQSGIPEDPVTGSAHTTLAPYWADRLGRNELSAKQLSKRRGWLKCRVEGDRVEISGQARAYMTGEIDLE